MVSNANDLISDIKTGGSLGCSGHTLVEFSPEGYGKGEGYSQDPKCLESQIPALQGVRQEDPLGNGPQTGEQHRTGRSLRTLSTEHKSSQSPGVRKWARKGRHQHGGVETYWSN